MRTKPLDGPVECAEERPGGHRRVGLSELPAPDAGGDQRPHDALIAVAAGDDRRAPPGWQGVELEVRRRTPHIFDQAAHVLGGQDPQARGDRSFAVTGRGGVGEKAIEGAVLAEVENLVLAAEVVVQVGGREIRGHRDIAHAGGGKPHLLEHPGGGNEDRGAARLGSPLLPRPLFRTAVRTLNHRSIVGDSRGKVKSHPLRWYAHL